MDTLPFKRMRLKSPERTVDSYFLKKQIHHPKRRRSNEIVHQERYCRKFFDSLIENNVIEIKAVINIQRIYRGWRHRRYYYTIKYVFYTY